MSQVEIFTKSTFEAALPRHNQTGQPLWEYVGLVQGEHTYRVRPFPALPYAIEVRSSVKSDGKSAATGQDSIRCWITTDKGGPFGGKIGRWTTRLPGWQQRLTLALRTLATMINNIKACPSCGSPCPVWKAGNKAKPENKGRLFRNCPNKCQGAFAWLDHDTEEVKEQKTPAISQKPVVSVLDNTEATNVNPFHTTAECKLRAILTKAIARLEDHDCPESADLATELRTDLRAL